MPYIAHPHAVVSMLKEWGYSEESDPATLAVAWGHDVLEDTDTPESAIREIDDMLGERILSGIKMLTFAPDVSGETLARAPHGVEDSPSRRSPGLIVVVDSRMADHSGKSSEKSTTPTQSARH